MIKQSISDSKTLGLTTSYDWTVKLSNLNDSEMTIFSSRTVELTGVCTNLFNFIIDKKESFEQSSLIVDMMDLNDLELYELIKKHKNDTFNLTLSKFNPDLQSICYSLEFTECTFDLENSMYLSKFNGQKKTDGRVRLYIDFKESELIHDKLC